LRSHLFVRFCALLVVGSSACATASYPNEGPGGVTERGPDGGGGGDAPKGDGGSGGGLTTADARVAPDGSGGGAADAPAGCTPTWISLLNNGGFDAGSAGWTESTLGGVPIITSDAVVEPDTPPGFAWFGGYDNAVDRLSQSVTIPAGATSLRLSGTYCIETDESGPFDEAAMVLRNGGGSDLEVLASGSSDGGPSTCGAIANSFEVTAGSPYAGQTVSFVIEAFTDDSLLTNFFFDSLMLEALACP
jgi:hypothetical protein